MISLKNKSSDAVPKDSIASSVIPFIFIIFELSIGKSALIDPILITHISACESFKNVRLFVETLQEIRT